VLAATTVLCVLSPDTLLAQELHVRLLPFGVMAGGDSALPTSLRQQLVDGLNARSRPRFHASSVAADDHDASAAKQFTVSGRVSYDGGRDGVSIVITNAAGKQHAAFDVFAARNERHLLLRDAVDRLALVLATSIRIGILEFQRTGGDSLQYHGLQRTLPNMLIARLGGSAHLALIELTDAENLRRLRAAGGTPARAVMAGDHANDIVAARGAGLPCIFAAWGYGPPAMADGAVAVARDITEMAEIASRLLPPD
jgi:hypothetical protein